MPPIAPSVHHFAPARFSWVGPLLLTRSEIARVPPDVPGVYLLHLFAPARGAYAVFYAGKSTDLRQRLTDHASNGRSKASIWWLRRNQQAYFSAAPVLDRELRDRVEAGLIVGLQPPCNDQLPTAIPLFVHLPPLQFDELEKGENV